MAVELNNSRSLCVIKCVATILVYCLTLTVVLLFVGITCWINLGGISSTRSELHDVSSTTSTTPTCLHRTCVITPAIKLSFARHRTQHSFCRFTRLLLTVNLFLVGVETNPGPARPLRGVKIGTLNARSAVKHTDDLHLLIASEALDVLAVCETRVTRDATDAISMGIAPEGYRVFNAPPPDDRQGGGLAIIFRDNLNVTSVQLSAGPTTFDLQAVRLVVGLQRFLFVNVYRPPHTDIRRFLDELSDVLDEVGSLGCHTVILGDFNCPGDSPVSIDAGLEAWLSCYDMSVSGGNSPTHLNYDGGLSRLDLIAESGHPRKLSSAADTLVGFSDHRLLTSLLDCVRPPVPTVTYSYRDIKRLDVDTFRKLLRSSSSVVDPSDDPDTIVRQLDADLGAVLDRLAPMRTRTRRCGKPETRWLSEEVVQAKRNRRRMERQYIRSRSLSDRKAYRAICRSTHKLITESRSAFVRGEIENAAGSPRLLWRTVNRLLHPAADRNWFDGMDTATLANGFSNFFADKVARVKAAVDMGLRSFGTTVMPCPPPLPPSVVLSSFAPVSAAEVERLIRAAPSKTSPLDAVPIALFKQCSDELSVIIANLANRSFATGQFPASMKSGLVTPLIKKPGLDVSDYKNFRPITNLSTVSKLLERLALARLKPHIAASPNFCALQSAYRGAHSTETALVKVVDDLLTAIDAGSVVALVGLDISAAFDTVSHSVLLRRLDIEFGITGAPLQWIASYLSGRSVSVRVGKSTSPSILTGSGVPQGSVLGPILFTTYISPVGRLITSHGIGFHKYADDTQLYVSLRQSIDPSLDLLARCTTALQHWYWSNDLLLNPDKSEVTFLGTRQRLHSTSLPTHVTVAGSSVAVRQTLKTLGITLDSTLSFDDHVINTVRGCNYHLRSLRHLRSSLTRDVANTMACSIIGSRLDYCNALFTGMSEKNFDRLQRVQNNMARVVFDVRRRREVHSETLLRSLHWLPVRRRVDFKLATICYKAHHLGQPPYLSSLVRSYVPTRTLRSSDAGLLHDSRSGLVTADRRFSVAAPRLWNKLPLTIKSADTLNSFKSQLKTLLFDSPIV